MTALRRDVAAYLELDRSADAGEREERYACVVESERKVRALDPRLRQLIRDPDKLEGELSRVHALHAPEKRPDVELKSPEAPAAG